MGALRSVNRLMAVGAVGVAALGTSPRCVAEVTTSYGVEFVTVGAPGNRDTVPFEVPLFPEMAVGGVGYEYRLSRTEITTRQWLPFVRAYAPYIQAAGGGSAGGAAFTSLNIYRSGGQYHVVEGTIDWPVAVSWRIAARYANWMHNRQSAEAWAFESGAYDTSTFGVNAQGFVTDQRHHAPGARFWLPTLDEWYKGVYYDPDRYGPGQGGYWLHPGSSNEELISGPPEMFGAQTNAGFGVPPGPTGMAAGQYPDTQTPWGMLDASGGVREMSEDDPYEAKGWAPEHRYAFGSYYREPTFSVHDRLDWGPGLTGLDSIEGGIRLAAGVVPAPGAAIGVATSLFLRRARR